ncbi:cysteine--1-D-myo-inosityl 2-amino-2-deoxy-alpha-D-glucopyranoside ligase [Xylanimonas oleitrophica]|uniref:L-cysteine:1D-myo-inositol 2-amino-2-deoxy-alpha-D-glucopyranoside ligase n=1 Tax=Xylanimonas oleitrophica TaxID=2607479 RepID=A0A2W5YDU7_9MICO|nr:cysteine--1-D-myo-inosityl 2-amino-2-deoxy-alpha-D-glucopyranoside ligase [Xylanimonas oleitrophica]PZR52491.1 cysteine--1-D-myo-inosityl 2-amino-2-deoxy-alpha-D-glucopyranoside ligase [Xylanimonas oleitrophica]
MRTWQAPDVPQLPRPAVAVPVRVHDSTTRELVEAAPGPTARLYVCGITPYDATHLGHANTYLAFDLLQRAWLDAGKQVVHTSNVTDVDDPLLERAAATGVDWRDLAAEQTELFRTDMTALRMLPPATWTGAVESVPAVVEAVERLLAAGAAYRVPVEAGELAEEAQGTADLGDVYADLSADASFGQVSRLDEATMAELFAERGGDPGRAGKKHPLDPLLWRRARVGEPAWDGGTLGSGRPGWHIECAVIARDGLGLPFDVQGGGADLLFPHHEMSTSHDRLLAPDGAHGAPRVHVHAGLVAYDGAKMSKSRGNLVLVSRLRESGVDPMALRLALLAHHYRDEWEWTDADLESAAERLARWRAAVGQLAGAAPVAEPGAVLAGVRAALADDLDAPAALAVVDAWAADPASDDTALVTAALDALLGVRL